MDIVLLHDEMLFSLDITLKRWNELFLSARLKIYVFPKLQFRSVARSFITLFLLFVVLIAYSFRRHFVPSFVRLFMLSFYYKFVNCFVSFIHLVFSVFIRSFSYSFFCLFVLFFNLEQDGYFDISSAKT